MHLTMSHGKDTNKYTSHLTEEYKMKLPSQLSARWLRVNRTLLHKANCQP